MVRLRRWRRPGRGAGVGVRYGGEALVLFRLHEASLVPSSGAARHLLPMGEGMQLTGSLRRPLPPHLHTSAARA
ncbi:hypothetical protein X12_000641 [Xanthomonas arboricola]|uniref:Uncharacterized protein n=1 Tax=Xanthomonas campestris pv. juglandis TaxID=195709 RepID=A0A8E4GCR9_XANCJ|nr:hypothetical protein KP727_19350 [Xanthomonas arboricola pv. juglandis]CAD2253216.1 hypothetical protein X12_000698 [Xanthomonas arboricola]CAD1787337.1 hypothetical protein XSP_000554 [Xanthomonas arboricola pv. juglandis]CAD2262763.1 hypothetical protein X12_003613 [Xanthomonas arboricola]CAD7349812.1 hypothetical protein X12_003660 [Xanthomonas arboricola]